MNSPLTGGNFHSLILFLSERVKYLFFSFTCNENNLAVNPKKIKIFAAEIISLNIDNDLLDFQGIGNCTSLPFGITINYEAFIPTENPNPHTHLVYNVKPKSIQLELVNIPDCDFSMLEDVKVYLVNNGTSGTINDFILQDPANPSSEHNAVKIGQYLNVPNGIGHTMNLEPNYNAILDQFIYDESFQTFMSLNFDKAFTASSAIIKATIVMEVTLINE